MRYTIRQRGFACAFAAASLSVAASPANAEVINLNCGMGNSFWVDTGQKTITFGTVTPGEPREAPADIDDQFIRWKSAGAGDFSYQIDRATGAETMSHNGVSFPAGKCSKGAKPMPATSP